MSTYSFMDVTASITGVGGSFDLGYGAAVAEEGITTSMIENKNTMTIGADGEGMHSLHAGKGGTVTVNLLKTSPTNRKLSAMYNAQSQSSATWGNNIILIRNTASEHHRQIHLAHKFRQYRKTAHFFHWQSSAFIKTCQHQNIRT